MTSLAEFGKGLLWVAAIGVVAFFYGYYGVASGWLGLWTLIALAAASVGLLFLFRSCSKRIAVVNYEMCVLAIWFAHLTGTGALGGYCDIEWFFISFFLPWLLFAVVGGIAVLALSRKAESPNRRTICVATGILLAAAALVACGFADLRFCEEQPVTTFRAVPFFLQAIAFSPDGATVATVGGLSGYNPNVQLWDAATGRVLGECDKERVNSGAEKAAVQCFGNPPVVAASSYLTAYPRSNSKIVIQIWDLATRKLRHRLQWDDSLELRHSLLSRDGRWFVYCCSGHLRAYDLQAERVVVDLDRPKEGGVCFVAVSPARDRLACATQDGVLEIWDVVGARLAQEIRTSGQASCADFSQDGQYLAYGTDSGTVELIEIGDEKNVCSLSCFCGPNGVGAVAFSPDGALLACGGGDEGYTKVIDLDRWEVVAVLRTWGGWRTECLVFSLDSHWLATGDANGRVSVWDTTKWRGK